MAKTLSIAIVADTAGFSKGLGEAESRTKKFTRAAGVAGTALLGGLVVGLKKSADAAMDAQRVQAQTQAQLKALGISYQQHAQQIDKVIGSTSKLAAIDDEDLQGAFNDLVRTTGDVSKALKDTALAADISRGKHISLQAASALVTKAELGKVGALTKAGIAVDKNATKLELLDTLHRKFAGSAEAYGKTAAGSQERFGIAVENLEESMGSLLLPVITKVSDAMANLAGFLEKHTTLAKVLAGAVAVLATAMIAVSIATKLANLAMLASPLGAIVIGLAALVAVIVIAIKHWDDIKAAMEKVWSWIKDTFLGVWDDIKNALQSVKDWVTDHWPEIATLLSGPFALILAPATNAFGVRDKLTEAFTAVKDWAKARIDDVVNFFTGMGGRIWDGFTGGWDTTKSNIGAAFDWVKTHASEVIGKVVEFFTGLPGKIGGAIGGAMGDLKDKLGELFSWKKIVGWIKDALGFGSPSPHFMAIGHDMVDSMIRGVGDAAGLLKGAVGRLARDVIGNIGGGVMSVHPFGLGKDGGDNNSSGIVKLGRSLQSMGFQVGEHPAFGGVHPVHAKGSYHYLGRAIDVNWPGGGPVELKHLYQGQAFANAFGPVEDMIEDAGRANQHLHVALGKGGIVTGPTMALIGERGPEAVIPLDKYRGGGDTYTFNFPNYVGSRDELVSALRSGLKLAQNRNGNLGFTS